MVSTSHDQRREGHCRVLMEALEATVSLQATRHATTPPRISAHHTPLVLNMIQRALAVVPYGCIMYTASPPTLTDGTRGLHISCHSTGST